MTLHCPLNVKVLHSAPRFTVSRTALNRYLRLERQVIAAGGGVIGEIGSVHPAKPASGTWCYRTSPKFVLYAVTPDTLRLTPR